MPYPSRDATSITPGTPISGGTGSFTTLRASTSFIADGDFGAQIRAGKVGQAGKIEFARSNDGGFAAGLGYISATESSVIELFNSGGGGAISIKLNRSVTGFSEAVRFSSVNDGSISIGNIAPTARLHLPAGAAAAGRAPFKFTSGPLLTAAEGGGEEFLTNDRYYTGTDGARRRYAVNGQVLTLRGFTVATLPAAVQGDKAFVTDALAPAYLVAVASGGAVVTEVFHNGTAWVCT